MNNETKLEYGKLLLEVIQNRCNDIFDTVVAHLELNSDLDIVALIGIEYKAESIIRMRKEIDERMRAYRDDQNNAKSK